MHSVCMSSQLFVSVLFTAAPTVVENFKFLLTLVYRFQLTVLLEKLLD